MTERQPSLAELPLRSLFEAVCEGAPLGILACDRAGTVLYINQEAGRQLGLHRPTVVGRSILEAVPRRASELRTHIDNVLSRGGPLKSEEDVDQGGERRCYSLVYDRLCDASGAAVGVRIYSQDITAQRESDVQLRASEQRFRMVHEHSPVAVALVNVDGTPVLVNQAFASMMGYEVEELIAMNFAEFTHPDDFQRKLPLYEELIAGTRDVYQIDKRNIRKDGSVVWLSTHIVAVRDSEGQLEYLIGLGEDISERKQTEEELRRLYDMTPDLICVGDMEGNLLRVNPAFTKILGYSEEELLSKPYTEFVHPADRSGTTTESSESVYDGRPMMHFTNRWLTIDGQVRHLNWTAVPHPNGREVYAIARDITEHEELRWQVSQADRLASMGTLAAGVAHEINNPLTSVLYNLESIGHDLPRLVEGSLTLRRELERRLGHEQVFELVENAGSSLLDGATCHDLEERFADALTNIRRIRDVTRSLRTFSRVGRDDPQPTDVRRAVEAALSMAGNELRYRARVVTRFANVPAVMADENRLAQVFLNLLVNAAHAIEEGRVEENEVSVRVWSAESRVFVEIRDTGCGIPETQLDSVFDPFVSTQPRGSGTGLGLTISRDIIASFAGQIEVTSQQGLRTSVVVQLPLGEATDSVGQETRPASPMPKPARILFVDDEIAIGKAIIRKLTAFDVVVASSAREAKAVLVDDRSLI